MTRSIVYVDHSDVHEGSLQALKEGVAVLVEHLGALEPQLVAYAFYFDPAGERMTVIAVHPDSTSIEKHLEIGGPEFKKLAGYLTLRSIEVYGDVSERALSMLRQKAEMLGGASVTVGTLHAGFFR